MSFFFSWYSAVCTFGFFLYVGCFCPFDISYASSSKIILPNVYIHIFRALTTCKILFCVKNYFNFLSILLTASVLLNIKFLEPCFVPYICLFFNRSQIKNVCGWHVLTFATIWSYSMKSSSANSVHFNLLITANSILLNIYLKGIPWMYRNKNS